MNVKVITVGNKSDAEIATMIAAYEVRLPKNVSLSWHYIKHAKASDPNTSMNKEAELILKAMPDNTQVILLDETGTQLSSPKLSAKLFNGRDSVVIIGGAYGVARSIFERADFVWSLSDLVFPHQIVRLILAEQVYRAHTIHINHPYHHS